MTLSPQAQARPEAPSPSEPESTQPPLSLRLVVCVTVQVYYLQSTAGGRGQPEGRLGASEVVCVCVFITAGPITKLFAGGEEESGGHG